jgi:oxygen-independent coproporphyrinogen-3 oxidase
MTELTALLEKYSKPGPATPHTRPPPTSIPNSRRPTGAEELESSQSASRGLSLYVHIPFCDTLCYYCGCNMVATGEYSKATQYLGYLDRRCPGSPNSPIPHAR